MELALDGRPYSGRQGDYFKITRIIPATSKLTRYRPLMIAQSPHGRCSKAKLDTEGAATKPAQTNAARPRAVNIGTPVALVVPITLKRPASTHAWTKAETKVRPYDIIIWL